MTILSLIDDEDGMSLVELLGAMVILSIVLPLLIGFIVTNAKMIEQNTILTEAIAVREEIREWMSYQAQTQDIADLNPYVFAIKARREDPTVGGYTEPPEDPSVVIRSEHLILDKSGISKDAAGNSVFGEIAPSDHLVDDGGNTITSSINRKRVELVTYDSQKSFPKIKLDTNRRQYIGTYVGPGASEFKATYAVLAQVSSKKIMIENGASPTKAENQDSGILVTLRIYNSESGKELTNTQFHWGADY